MMTQQYDTQHYDAQRAAHYEKHGLYDPSEEHDACGVGLIATVNGQPRREVVEKGIAALQSVWHRGAVNADGKTGDGAGVHFQIPEAFFMRENVAYRQAREAYCHVGVGMLFLPRTNAEAQETAKLIIETEIVRLGYDIIGWRQVPVCTQVIGDDANLARPEIMQVFIRANTNEDQEAFEQQLYVIRRRIENALRHRAIQDGYICSLSSRYIIYKGLFQASQLSAFYPELQDASFISSYIIFHQRFSTNTAPSWHLAQPFRTLAHNGEINTLRGNVNWMSSYEACFGSSAFAGVEQDLVPIIPAMPSDTAALDAVMEFVTLSGHALPFAKLMMMPPAWSRQTGLPLKHRALYEYCNCLMSPWDGPAAIAATDGRWIIAGTDRNGLRPLRYAVTQDGLLSIGSEAGIVPIEDSEVTELGQLAPGQMLGVDMVEGRLYHDTALKDMLAAKGDYQQRVKTVTHLSDIMPASPTPYRPAYRTQELTQRQYAACISQEELDVIFVPMILAGKEAIGSMGDDTPLAILSNHHRGMHHFFRQHFSQVTNPPIDPLREQHTMSLITRIGYIENILGQEPDFSRLYHLDSPILLEQEYTALTTHIGTCHRVLDITYPADASDQALRHAIDALKQQADDAIADGAYLLVLDDSGQSDTRMAIPAILAAGAVHTHMVRQSKRKQLSIVMRTSAVLDTHSIAVLIGVGATAIHPYLAEATIGVLHQQQRFDGLSLPEALQHLKQAYEQGLLKIMSKMGISVISSYRGGRNFDAIGLSRSLVAEFFPGLVSRISGIGLKALHQRLYRLHQDAWQADDGKVMRLPVGGHYRYRHGGETHAYEGELIHRLQTACATGSYRQYQDFAQKVNAQTAIHVRSLLEFHTDRAPIALDTVESVNHIRKRFIAPAMSLGALSPEAHETLAIAMNRIGAGSNSGEGGEGADRFTVRANGDNANCSIKQVASGRFGVTANYLSHAKEIQIKVAQGAKPGEGGQLPSFKVTAEIAHLRHSTQGVTLISPPPHHDIYSIEDLAQLIYDLKQANPDALVSVKLVSQSGIGTIASGVAKAMADKIVISGHVGGTGASPYTSIKYAGAPWEIGLAEVQQVLSLNRLRHRVTLQTDGGLKTGRDIVIAALLGAEEYALGTLSLVAMGCLMVRQCHSNTCPVGICTQDPMLRKHFDGSVDKVVNLVSFIAEDIREILATLGYATLDEIIGRTDLLYQVVHEQSDVNALDLTPLLTQPVQAGEYPRINTVRARNPVDASLDEQIIAEAHEGMASGQKVQLSYTVQNTHRSIGTRLSHYLLKHYDTATLQEDHLHIMLRGTAGQSLGAFMGQGITIEMLGDANDYVGKGLCGGHLILRPAPSCQRETHTNAIIGNTVLYGATAGTLFAAGRAGERFAVRNSGAQAVIEGCGSNGCEYMTGGVVVILGRIGSNFAAGMTGGMAFIYAEEQEVASYVNHEHVLCQPVQTDYWKGVAYDLITTHAARTHSLHAQNIVNQWEFKHQQLWQICPKELLDKLDYPIAV